MADEPTTTETPPSETPAAVTPPPAGETPAATTTTTTTTTDAEPFDADRARRTIETQREAERKAKADAKDAKTRADAAEARVKELESASMSEQEKRDAAEREKTDRLTALEREQSGHAAERRQFTLERAVWRLANHEDFLLVDPDAAVKLLDAGAVTFADDGVLDQPSLEKALKQLLKDRPFLKRSTTVQSGATTNPSRSQQSAPDSPEARRARIFGTATNIFDPTLNRALGGGPFMPPDPTRQT